MQACTVLYAHVGGLAYTGGFTHMGGLCAS